MDGNLLDALKASLREEPSSVDEIALSLSAILPIAAARGTPWLERELGRAPFASRLDDGRWVARPDDDELIFDDENGAGPARTTRPPRIETVVVLDLETNADTADAREHEIIEVGACLVENGSVSERLSSLVLNSRPLSPSIVELTGISDDDLRRNGRPVREALSDLLAFVGSHPMVAHNGFSYDFVVLDAACMRLGLSRPSGLRLDLLELAHVAFPRAGEETLPNIDGTMPPANRSLGTLARSLGVEHVGQAHRALDDAETTVRVMQAMLELINRPTPMRRLQSWLLVEGSHPWGSLTVAPAEPPPLENCIDDPEQWPEITPTGVYDIESVVAPLRNGGALMQEGRLSRPQQLKMAKRVATAAANSERVMIEAPTGTGKTLAYLTPAIGWARATGRSVIVATHSKVLQSQIVTSIPELEAVFGQVRSTLIKGRDNYLSLGALDSELEGPPSTPDDALALAVIVGWAALTPTGDWDDLRAWAIERTSPALRRYRQLLHVDESESIASGPLGSACFHRRALRRMESADLAILNHAVLIARNGWLESPEDNRLLIVDEAHNLEESATGALTEEIAGRRLDTLFDAVHDPRTRWGFLGRYVGATGASLRDEKLAAISVALKSSRANHEALGTTLVAYVSDRAGVRRAAIEQYGASYRIRPGLDTARPAYLGVRSASRALASALRQLAGALDDLPVPSATRGRYKRHRLEAEKARLARRIRDAATLVYEIPHCEQGDDVDWINIADLSITNGVWRWSLRRVPLSVAGGLSEIWKKAGSVVLTSATLAVAGDFSHLATRVGISAQPYLLPTPFEDLALRHLMVLPGHLPTPRGSLMDEFTIAEADEIARLLAISNGRALVLMTSRARLEKVRDHVRAQLQPLHIPLLAQGEEPSPALADRMRNDERASLLALRSFWEGIDVPGSALSLLIVEKLPFDTPGDPVVLARMDDVERSGGDPFADYLVPRAALRFVQGVGRLIRGTDDVGATVVLDKRLRRPTPYREQFLGSLPGPPTILRPLDAAEGYQAIADHLGRSFDAELESVLESFESADPWGDISELTPAEAADPEAVRAKLEEVRVKLGFVEWRPGQVEVMQRFIAGEDVLAVMPTGSGKSATFQIPALISPGVTLVISPLVALMRDQVESLRARGVHRVAGIYGGLSQSEQEEILVGARSGRYKLIYVSPERLWSGRFRQGLAEVTIARVAVDEAHCISQWGHSFRPEYAAIPGALASISGEPRPPVLAVTATATERVRNEVIELLKLDIANESIVQSPDRPELQYFVEDCDSNGDRDVRVVEILEGLAGQSAVVYVPRRTDADRLAGILRSASHAARAYHGGMPPEERLNTEEAFRFGEIDVVVATKAFGLGVDKPDIAAIVHLEMPASVEEYVQETGRAARGARDGVGPAVGHCVLLRTPRDCRIHGMFVKTAAPDIDVVRAVWSEASAEPELLLPIAQLADRLTITDVDPESVALALHYLIEDGVLTRQEDVMWRGRVWLPPDADRLLDELEHRHHELAKRGRAAVDAIRKIGSEEYDAEGWPTRFGLDAAELERLLLELNRRDVIGLAAWEFAAHVHRTEQSEPKWDRIARRCAERGESVARLSTQAKAYARQDATCRRAWLLEYLGIDAPERCGRCDVCDRALARPWQARSLQIEQLQAALPIDSTLQAMLRETGGRFSRRSIEHALAGSSGGRFPISEWLREHRLFGRLATLGPKGVTAEVERQIEAGLIEEVEIAGPDRTYKSIRPKAETRIPA